MGHRFPWDTGYQFYGDTCRVPGVSDVLAWMVTGVLVCGVSGVCLLEVSRVSCFWVTMFFTGLAKSLDFWALAMVD